ncbi:hypothetical protein SpCBS45565_g04624 [Spizellomyces sp. 'palustris']|nr:hypothetical protein SpCBS45565_g04624 [Spizellomyces sp. 'palustris']
MAFAEPDVLATGSYDGEIVVRSLGSGCLIGRLRVGEEGERGRSVDKVLFLHSRLNLQNTAHLLSSGSDGQIRWWNTHDMYLMLSYDGTHGRNEGIFSMATNPHNTVLVTGDTAGYITVWDIGSTCVGVCHRAGEGMACKNVFRAHLRSVVSLDLVVDGDQEAVVSASTDCTVRMFTLTGQYIGTFGQTMPWDLYNPSTYAYPSRPPEITLDEVDESNDEPTCNNQGEQASTVISSVKSPPAKPETSHRAMTATRTPKPFSPSTQTPTYKTWYAKSKFAEKFIAHPSRRPRILPPLTHTKPGCGGVAGTFHRLEPYELAEVGRVGREKK